MLALWGPNLCDNVYSAAEIPRTDRWIFQFIKNVGYK